jgi:hypothetical protein
VNGPDEGIVSAMGIMCPMELGDQDEDCPGARPHDPPGILAIADEV